MYYLHKIEPEMMNFNLYPAKCGVGCIAGLLSMFADDLKPLFQTVLIFEAVDLCTGVMKSIVVARRNNRQWAFESVKAWRTIYKVVFLLVGVYLAERLDYILADERRLRLANYFTGFCCGVEFWSFLENAAVISEHPIFLWLRKYMKFRVDDEIGANKKLNSETNETDR